MVSPSTYPSQFEHNFDVDYKCPIGHEIMFDPVIAADGHNYERTNITRWFEESGSRRSPMTNEEMTTLTVFPNLAMRSQIREWLTYIKNKPIPEDIQSLVDDYYEKQAVEELDRATQEAICIMNNQMNNNYNEFETMMNQITTDNDVARENESVGIDADGIAATGGDDEYIYPPNVELFPAETDDYIEMLNQQNLNREETRTYLNMMDMTHNGYSLPPLESYIEGIQLINDL